MDAKFRLQLEKLEIQSKRSAEELNRSKENVKADMDKARVSIKEWEEKQLAAGKNPDKVKKQVETGYKSLVTIENKLEGMFTRLETKNEEWQFKSKSKLEKAAKRRLIRTIFTSSLNKMEKMLKEDPENPNRMYIAGYCAIAKKKNLKPVQHKHLIDEVRKWEEAVQRASKDDDYYNVYQTLLSDSDKKEKKLEFKIAAAKKINSTLEENNISIRFLSEYTGIKYPNVYNFLKKDLYSDISFRRTHQLLWSSINISLGLSKEEAAKVHLEKIDKLKEYWDEEILGSHIQKMEKKDQED